MSLQQNNIVVACGEACLNHEHCEQPNRVFSRRLHSLLMLTWGQDASQQESGNLRWVSVTLAFILILRHTDLQRLMGVFQCVTSDRWGNIRINTCTCFRNMSILAQQSWGLEKHFSGLILCVWACTIYPSERRCTHSVTHLGAGQLRAHTPPNLHAPRSRENGYS